MFVVPGCAMGKPCAEWGICWYWLNGSPASEERGTVTLGDDEDEAETSPALPASTFDPARGRRS